MNYGECNIQQFMNCWFKKDYSEVSLEDFKIIYAEYVDTSGLFMSEDFERQGYINHLSQRINSVKIFIRLQREFIADFNMPFIRDFESFKDKYGYVLKWSGDLMDFKKQLEKVEKREVKHNSFLEEKIKELSDSRKNNQNKTAVDDVEEKLIKSRTYFIRMLNSLGKIGYKLDKKNTTVEELSLMIKQQMEDTEQKNAPTYGR